MRSIFHFRIRALNYFTYYTEIEETFIRRRGRSLLLSPIDWALIDDWKERGIPLHIALRAIENVFDAFDKNPRIRTIKSLMYCREEIEAQYDEWRKSQIGKSTPEADLGNPEQNNSELVKNHIDGLIEHFRRETLTSLQETFDRVVLRLEEVRQFVNDDIETVDRSLSDVESFLESSLRTNIDPEMKKNIEHDVTLQMRPYKSSMSKEDYKRTFELVLLKRIREEFGIPRLSLFYL